MHTELEPIGPAEALELYLTDRRGDLSDIEEEGLTNLNNLTGRTVRKYKIWRRDHGDINGVTLKTQIDTVRVFVKWLEAIEGCPPDLAAKIESPAITPEENSRSVELHSGTSPWACSGIR